MLLNCHYFSPVLGSNTEINVIIPTPEGNEQITAEGRRERYDYARGLPVVYLLHGAFGDSNSWCRFSSIERYVQAKSCIAVMSSVENSFYQNMYCGKRYFTYMTEELPVYITSLFPASRRREDSYIAGFSMGGYGAWYLALSRPELYAAAASMSGALNIVEICKGRREEEGNPFHWNAIFPDPDALEGSSCDLLQLFREKNGRTELPRLYQSCGEKDMLFSMNQEMYKRLSGLGAKIHYREAPEHGHDWSFWDLEIREILDWFFPER